MSPVSKGRKRKPAKASRKRHARRQAVEQSLVPTAYLDDLPPAEIEGNSAARCSRTTACACV